MIKAQDLEIPKLGVCRIPSPLTRLYHKDCKINFVAENETNLFYAEQLRNEQYHSAGERLPLTEIVGPRAEVYFDPQKTKAAIVTCGGLCPGINAVIRGIVMELHYRYGVEQIEGIKYGYQGFIPEYGHEPLKLTPDLVKDIHTLGGTILGTSRGAQDVGRIVDFLEKRGINLLFVIGGDGTLRGALEISVNARQRKKEISVIGIPKTIDNDILHIDQSFGFESAFSEAVKAIVSANTEAVGFPDCIGIVKLMGRDSGFISCAAALAMSDVNYVFIPEVPFAFDGPNGFLEHLKARLERRRHAVIVIAEGAGQEHFHKETTGKDASGNVHYHDIGLLFKDRIQEFFKSRKKEITIKYIDPSYMIRSIPASPLDSAYCLRLAQSAVHAAMSGRTEMVVGLRHNALVHLPMKLIARGRKRVDPAGPLWFAVLEATGQPAQFTV